MGTEYLAKYSSAQESKHIPMDRVDDASKETMLENGRALIEWLLSHDGYVGAVQVKRILLELHGRHHSLSGERNGRQRSGNAWLMNEICWQQLQRL